ncbi:MAG: YlmC/YmxH family sporulation protein [Oscillospiraceae bacterium]|nr:YlmC/YmxH family sporulation protein [Oscillospiraceae bacterium]
MLFSELRDKEVVSAVNGVRLGLIDDFEFDQKTAKVQKLYIYGRGELFGLGSRSGDLVIDWTDIETIGGDIILIKKAVETPSAPRRKGLFR